MGPNVGLGIRPTYLVRETSPFPGNAHSERSTRLSVVQHALGNRSAESTRVYARTTGSTLQNIRHPIREFRLG